VRAEAWADRSGEEVRVVVARRGDEAVARDEAAEAQALRRADTEGRKVGQKKALVAC
jgi:hypothetical protein